MTPCDAVWWVCTHRTGRHALHSTWHTVPCAGHQAVVGVTLVRLGRAVRDPQGVLLVCLDVP